MSELPDVRNIIVSREFLRENSYHETFDYLEFPLRSVSMKGAPLGPTVRLWNGFADVAHHLLYQSSPRTCSATRRWQWCMATLPGRGAALGLARRLNAPMAVSYYGCDYEHLPATVPVWSARFQILFRRARMLICEGPHGANVLEGMGCPKDKIQVVRLGVDTGAIPTHERAKRAGELRLLQVANLSEKKGHIYALKAFLAALSECPHMTFTIVGRNDGGRIRAALESEIRMAGAEEKVSFHDWINWRTLHLFMKDFHVFIHTELLQSGPGL